MHAELREVCSGLRAHAGFSGAQVVIAGAAAAGGLGAAVKGLFASTKIQIGVAASSVAAAGVLGFVVAPWGGDGAAAPVDLAGKRGVELEVTPAPAAPPSTSLRVTTGNLTTEARGPERRDEAAGEPQRAVTPTSAMPAKVAKAPVKRVAGGDGARAESPAMTEDAAFDESSPVVYRETTVERHTTAYDGYSVVYETTTVYEVNARDQSRTTTRTTSYTQPQSTTQPPAGGEVTARTAESTPAPAAPNGP
jgi:hypothetical protein